MIFIDQRLDWKFGASKGLGVGLMHQSEVRTGVPFEKLADSTDDDTEVVITEAETHKNNCPRGQLVF